MLTIQNLSYSHPNKELLFSQLNLSVQNGEKVALIGNNGVGKSTLLKLMAGVLSASEGVVNTNGRSYYIPQIFGQYNHLTIAEALGVSEKIIALHNILNGKVSEQNYDRLNDDWTIEERCAEALNYWKLSGLDFFQKLGTLSGGEKTKVFLAGNAIHKPDLVLLDEPSNHLDHTSRELLYSFIESTKQTLVIVSHDRALLNRLNIICELRKNGIKIYGGNYDFYIEQKQIENDALVRDLHSKEKALKKAKEKEHETIERQQKLDSRGKAREEKAGVAKIMMNTLRNNAEKSTAKLKTIHAEKSGNIRQELQDLRSSLPVIFQMKVGFDHPNLHKGKTLFIADGINHLCINGMPLWRKNISLQITSGERIAVKGQNGSGKTTLIRLLLGYIKPHTGKIQRAETKAVYIDQDYSLIQNNLNVYEQAQRFNSAVLQEHEIKIRLNRFLFTKDNWEKSCSLLSGGERMRLVLSCLSIGNQAPDIIILDEPTNNLDIQNIEILTNALKDYQGTLIVISHDETFLHQLSIERVIEL